MGYSHNLVAYRVLNKRTRKIKETFNLNFDNSSRKTNFSEAIIFERAIESEINNSFDFDYALIFDVRDRAIHVEIHGTDNQIHESSKHSDDLTLTQEKR